MLRRYARKRKRTSGGAMKVMVGLLSLLCFYTLSAVTAEELYERGAAYHSHTYYGLKVAGLR
jgi:hypothetical protein